MRFGLSAIFYAVVASMAVAQEEGPANLPPCAIAAFMVAYESSACETHDARCVCSNQAAVQQVMSSIRAACQSADLAKTVTLANAWCGIPNVFGSASSNSTTNATITASPLFNTSGTSLPSLIIDTSSLAFTPPAASNTASDARSSSNAAPTSLVAPGAGDKSVATNNYGLSLAGLAVAIGGMAVVFAEL